jgi:hypothetical protein
VPEIVRNDAEHAKAAPQLKRQRAVDELAADHRRDVLLGRHAIGMAVVVAKTSARANAEQSEPPRQRLTSGVQLRPDAMSLKCRRHHDLGAVERAAMDGIVVGERAGRGEIPPRRRQLVVIPEDDQARRHSHDLARGFLDGNHLSFGKDLQVCRELRFRPGGRARIDGTVELNDAREVGRRRLSNDD